MIPRAAISVVPPESLALRAAVTAAFWFPLHEGAGTTLNNRIGAGPGTLALAGTTASVWDAWGNLRPVGDNYAETDLAEPVGAELFDLTDITGQQLLIGYELDMLDAVTTSHTVFTWGNDRNTAGKAGGWYHKLGATNEGFGSFVFRAAEGSASVTMATGASALSTGGKYVVVHSITSNTANEVVVDRVDYERVSEETRNGTVGPTNISSLGTGMPGVDSDSRLNLFCRRLSPASRSEYFGLTQSNRVLNNLWFARLSAPVTGILTSCRSDMIARPGEFPRSLRA